MKTNIGKKIIGFFMILMLFITSVPVYAVGTENVKVNINGEYVLFDDNYGQPFTDQNGRVQVPLRITLEKVGVNVFWDQSQKTVLMYKDKTFVVVPINTNYMIVNGKKITNDTEPIIKDGRTYLPIRFVMEAFDYKVRWDNLTRTVLIQSKQQSDTEVVVLPKKYDLREHGKVTSVKEQGELGTCWAFAALGAMESVLMPKEEYDFSEDNMTLRHGFSLSQNQGGDYLVALAYLTSWKGPVLEKDDPYGDNKTQDLPAVKHLQEAIIIPDKDIEDIKKAIMKYGGVHSSVFSPIEAEGLGLGLYYNDKTSALYNYDNHQSNHDIVIVGWDDDFPAENFSVKPKGNGAFICKNSWGEKFGQKGYYYVSYYDNNIAKYNVVYSKIEDKNNYDNIYQYDELGWIGELGYEDETAYFSNVFTSKGNEFLDAVSFYTTGSNSQYDIYVIKNFDKEKGFKDMLWLTNGEIKNSGYYTIKFKDKISLVKGQKFAAIVKLTTPGDKHPIAAEYYNKDSWATDVKVNPNESFISYDGIHWEDCGKTLKSNVCLKAFTTNKKDKDKDNKTVDTISES